jgi:DNA mismatch endonuclease (patch repair protein)
LVIFVDGEFWHGKNWDEKKTKIKSNREFWIPKIERNMQRDRLNNQVLSQYGWTVFRFWDSQIKNEFGKCIMQIIDYIEELEQIKSEKC